MLTLDLISTVDDVPSLEPEIAVLCSEKVSVNRSLCELMLAASSRNKLVVNTDECLRDLAAQRLAEHPAVAWVEVQAKMRLRNKYATRILQSDNGSSWALWDKGLKGNGEIIGITDTGVDYQSCFFRDEAITLPSCAGTGHVTKPGCINFQHRGCINFQHRKIVTYVSF